MARALADRTALLLTAALLGCGLHADPGDGLPSDPIAFIQHRASTGRLSLAELREALRAEDLGAESDRVPVLATELSLLFPASGALESVPGARPGDRPFDWSADRSRLLVGRALVGSRRLELYGWSRHSGRWNPLMREPVISGAAWADEPFRLVWGGERGSVRAPRAREIRELGLSESPGSLRAGLAGFDPDLAPDGSGVVFARPGTRPGAEGWIVRTAPDADEPVPLARGASPRFSRDGRWIVFTRGPAGSRDVWLMRSDGRMRRPLTESALYDEEHPSLSPDGAWVVYASARGTRQESQLYALRLSDRRERQLTLRGHNVWPVW